MQNEKYPSRLLERAVSEISKLPGIGRRTALRLALHLLQTDATRSHALAESIVKLRDEVRYCHKCHCISDTDLCDMRGVLSVEATGVYHGLYHVLGGVISPVDGVGPADLTLDALVDRVAEGGIKEVIMALSPTMEGDTTNFYVARRLEDYDVKVSVLSRGVSVGDELEYTDEVTLSRAIADRQAL